MNKPTPASGLTPFALELSKLARLPAQAEFRSPPSWIQALLPQLVKICERCAVQRLELFGSATSKHFTPEESDVDLLVLFKTRKPDDPRVYYFDLLEALEQLFKQRVDLVDETAVDNPFFLSAIAPARTLLYAA